MTFDKTAVLPLATTSNLPIVNIVVSIPQNHLKSFGAHRKPRSQLRLEHQHAATINRLRRVSKAQSSSKIKNTELPAVIAPLRLVSVTNRNRNAESASTMVSLVLDIALQLKRTCISSIRPVTSLERWEMKDHGYLIQQAPKL